MKLPNLNCPIIAVANQKGGAGKTTTTVNLGAALPLASSHIQKILIADFDPQGNSTQALGIEHEAVQISISDLIRDRSTPEQAAIYKTSSADLIPATKLLARVQLEMIGMTNGELRLAQRLRKLKPFYSVILIDAPPTLGTLMNSVLNAADYLLVPVESGVFSLRGIQSLLGEIEEIRAGTNPNLKILGFLLTLADSTNISNEVLENLKANFGDQVLKTQIRRSVKLKEAPAFGKTIFQHAPTSTGADDYRKLANEVLERLVASILGESNSCYPKEGSAIQGVAHA